MKKICLNIFMLFILHSLFGQTDLVLDQPESGNVIREAENSIRFAPGFSYKPALGETFIARIANRQNEGNNNLPDYNIAMNNIDQQPDFYGSIAGNIDVNALGGAIYTVPINVSPGTAGMQPNLAIVYNSQGGNGILGLSWGLSGMSSISRVSKNTYYDNTIAEITYDATPYNDALALDGNRLVSLSDSTFMTRDETFAKITLSGTGTNAWFKVEHKNGLTLEYGNTSDSKLYATGKTNPLAWLLNKISDPNGNYMQYFYTTINGESVLDRITYTGNSKTALVPYNTVKFNYKLRQDTNSQYIAGGTIAQKNILTSIKIECEGVKVKEIIFNYSESGIFSKLTTITEKFDENTSSSLSVSWGNFTVKKQIKSTQSYIKDVPSDQIFSGDFDGDGIDDILTYSDNQWKLSKGGNGAVVNITFTNQPSGLKVKETIVGDFNGDGKKDLVLLGDKSAIYHFNNGKFDYIQTVNAGGFKLMVGNFTTTEKDQILVGSTTTAIISIGVDGKYTADKQTLIKPDQLFPMNINGDMFTDLGILEKKKLHIYAMQGNDFAKVNTLDFPTEDIFVEDMNGDGLSDIVNITSDTEYDIHYGKGNGSYTKSSKSGLESENKYLASGYSYNKAAIDAGVYNSSVLEITKNINCCNKQYIVKDFNGDRKADILEIVYVYKPGEAIFNNVSEGCPNWAYYMLPFDPANFFKVFELLRSCYDKYLQLSTEYKRTHLYLYISGGGKVSWENFSDNDNISAFETIGDFTGDGQLDFLCKSRNAIYGFFCDATNSSDFLVKSITNNDLGESTDIKYTYASDKNVHTQGTGSSFPYNDYAGPMTIVSSVETPNGIGGKSKTEYTYSGLTLHRKGRGMLGFKSMTAKNITQGIQNTISYKETNEGTIFPIKSWVPYYSITTTTDGTKISSTGKKYAYRLPASGKPFGHNQVEADTVRNYLTNRYYYTKYWYDNYGNVTLSTITYSQSGISKEFSNSYVMKGAWCPSKPNTTTITQVYNGSTHTKNLKHTYDNFGNLLTVIEYEGKAKALTTTYVPNAYGLPNSVTLSAAGQTSRTNTFKYDTKYRFLTEKKNGLGQTVKMKYDAKTGNILEEENITTGLKSERQYDAIGRVKKAIAPDGITTQVYIKKSEANIPSAKYYILTTAPGSPYSKVYYDALGRVIKQETQGFDSKVFVESEYNAKGQLWKVSDPYKTSPSIFTSYAYDKFGRISTIQNQSLTTSYAYDGAKTSVTRAGKTHSETVDQLGNIGATEDNNGQILSYTYHGSGQLSSVLKVIGGVTELVKITYDEYGRQQTLKDIDAGTITYDYNAFGELVSQTDANGNIFTMEYDNLGRIKKKNSSTLGNATYNYYTDSNKAYHGLLKSVSRTDNMQQKYEYDNLGRLITYTDVIQGEQFNTKHGYDAYGNNILTSYPSGFTVENRYNKAGYLYDILTIADNKSIWKLQETDVYGAVRKVMNGNGLQTSYVYDSYGALTEIKTGNIQHLTYSIDPTSHSLISQRKDMKKNMTESFQYDNLNRMKHIQLNGGVQKSMEYSDNGNIKTKFDNGTLYQYHPQKPHAVETVTGGVDTSNQEITYNALNKTATIEQGNIKYEFKYGTDGQRRKMQRRVANALNLDRTYSVNYQKETVGSNTRETHYISTPTGVSAIFVKDNGNPGNIYYLCTDHLGSITNVVDANGTVMESYAYDPWGRRRNASNWNSYDVNPGSNPLVSRGYTGHEHLDDVGLINMNGRMYDPLLGRMLSPDNMIPDPFSLQGYNRYSYVYNNPMSYVDPDGENPIAWILAGAIWVGKLWHDGTKANGGDPNPFHWNWSNATYSFGWSSQGNTFSAGVGWNNEYGVMVGYSPDYGLGGGYSLNGSSNMYYPKYDNRVNQAMIQMEQNVDIALSYARETWDSFRYALPVYGSSQRSMDAFYSRDYLTGVSEFVMALFDMFTLGIGTEISLSVKSAGNLVKASSNSLKIPKNIEVINNTIEVVDNITVHGNSLKSTRPTWGYKLYDNSGNFLKNGITSKTMPQQRYTRKFMQTHYMEPIQLFPNRLDAWKWEYQQNLIQRGPLNLNMH